MAFDMTALLSNWIWVQQWTPKDDAEAKIVYFRKEFEIEEIQESLKIRITADSRYKLYINGVFVQAGPAKGDLESWFVDEAELVSYVKVGNNVIAVEVLRYPEKMSLRNHSLYRTKNPCLYVEDISLPDSPNGGFLSGKCGWKWRKADHIFLKGAPFNPEPLHIVENVNANKEFHGWKMTGFDDSLWEDAKPYSIFELNKGESPFNLVPRDIPMQYHEKRHFVDVVCVRECSEQSENDIKMQWKKLLDGTGSVEIPANSTQIVEISAGEEVCGYPVLEIKGGCNALIKMVPSECYAYERPPQQTPFGEMPSQPQKGDRTDFVNGKLHGPEDCYAVAGCGTDDKPEQYEPYWFRTFRYYRIEIKTGEEKICINRLDYISTGYPLEIKTSVSVSDESMEGIWDISQRSLKLCMHETYMDCPFYEQLQYAMDSRSEILYTYAVSGDDRLARRCMDDFRKSQRSDGMINSCAPTVHTNVIPGFSIYYILMVHDHMMYFGDRELVKSHFNCIDGILGFFDSNLTEKGLVGSIGGPLVFSKYWSFIDWCSQWNDTIGVPLACHMGDGSITMESLLYLYGLQNAAELAEYIGKADAAKTYRMRAAELTEAIRKVCIGVYTGDHGKQYRLVQDGPGVELYSTHCQVFAILTGVVTPEEGRKMLEISIGNEKMPQCSVTMRFYLFRALEMTGWYEKADELWNLWRKMVEDKVTTCVENDTDARSDCHAWGSTILHEIPYVYLGVRPASPGFENISIKPQMGHLTWAKGSVITPKGVVEVEWYRDENGECKLNYHVPEGVQVI